MRRLLATLLLAALFLLGAALGWYNWGRVHLDYLAGSLDAPLFSIVLGAFATGVVLTLLVTAGRIFGLKREISRARRQLSDTEAELRNLRNLPLKDA